MQTTTTTTPTNVNCGTDYFTIVPPTYDHFSTETPIPSPAFNIEDETSAFAEHPLLACRDPHLLSPSAFKMTATNFMSLQTSAAYNVTRPRPYAMQNVLHVTSDDSTTSESSGASSFDSTSSTSSDPPVPSARCSRCQRTSSFDFKTGKNNMVQYGLNLWYCGRCAGLVGLIKR